MSMHCYRFLAAVIMTLLFTAPSALAQIPANDSCAGAVTISAVPFSYSQNTRLATPDPNDPILACADSGGGKTVWFVYTADLTRNIMFSTTRSTPADYDVALGLYTGTCGALTEIECMDDSVQGSIRQAALAYEVQAGVTYYLHVAEWNGGGASGGVPTGGDLVLDVFEWTPLPLTSAPKQGSVAGGDSIVLSLSQVKNFPTTGGAGPWIDDDNRPQVYLPTPEDVRPPLAPAGSNLKKDPSLSEAVASAAYPVVWKNFQGNTPTGYFPPDPILAAGPNHVLGLVNSAFKVWDKDGNLLQTEDLNSWFSNVASPIGFSDPQVLYDHYSHRWIMAGGNFSPPYSFLISVSDDDDPLGTWYNWALPAGLGDSATGNLPDYPQIGYDSLAIYITSREYNPGLLYSRLRIVEKSQLYNNDAGPVAWTDIWDFREPDHSWIALDGLRPSIIFGSTGEHYLVNASPYSIGTFFTLWTVSDPVGTPSVTGVNIPVVEYHPAPNAGQLGGGIPVEAGGTAVRHKAVYRDSSLWITHSIGSGPGDAYSAVRYVRINPHTKTVLEDAAMGADGYWYYYPALMADADHNIVVTYTRSGLTEYPGAFVSGHKDTDPPGLMPNFAALATGQANYVLAGGDGRNRWGDYMGAALDPSDSLAIWVNTEFAGAGTSWQTRIGMVKFTPFPGPAIRTNAPPLAFGPIEVSDTAATQEFLISNQGDDTLVVSSIDLPDSNYHLIDPPTLPLELVTFQVETLRVNFIPEDRGVFDDSIMINTNDTAVPALKITLSGSGFIVDPAMANTMYASSGVADSGRLRTVDPLDASTAIVGRSGFTQLLNVRVNPVTGELMGLATTSTTTAAVYDLVRVNTSLGDAHSIGRIPFNFLKGLAYRGDTVFVGRITGGIYNYLPAQDTTVLVASSGLQLSGIDFNPVTGELWASVKGGATVDGIYKISLPSGTPTLIGSTGFGVPTVDIAFDANGSLFGLIGTGLAQNELALIDTLTGKGTIIGPMGLTTAQGIAFHPAMTNFAYSYHLFQKWNLMSLPIQVSDHSLDAIFPQALLQSRAFTFDGGGFIRTDTLVPRRGYWVKIVSQTAHNLIGLADSTDTISVSKGWTIIGPNSFVAPVSAVGSSPGGLIATSFYAYDDTGYVVADSLMPSRGYWVKTTAAGIIDLNAPSNVPSGSPKAQPRASLAGLNTLRIGDAAGRSQTLWFGERTDAGQAPPETFELPPVPPEAGFDARFGSGSMLALSDPKSVAGSTFPVRILSDRYPVTVSWHVQTGGATPFRLVSEGTDGSTEVLASIEGTGTRTLSPEQARDLILIAGSRVLPTEYALEQNYPNPFNPVTQVSYALPRAGQVRLLLYNALGEQVATLVDAVQEAGYHNVTISGENLASGVYFYRLTAGSYTSARKMLLLR